MVDHAFLLPPKLARPFTPRRSIDRQDYERQLDFYINSGYVDRPASFFSLPGTAPPHRHYRHGKHHRSFLVAEATPHKGCHRHAFSFAPR